MGINHPMEPEFAFFSLLFSNDSAISLPPPQAPPITTTVTTTTTHVHPSPNARELRGQKSVSQCRLPRLGACLQARVVTLLKRVKGPQV